MRRALQGPALRGRAALPWHCQRAAAFTGLCPASLQLLHQKSPKNLFGFTLSRDWSTLGKNSSVCKTTLNVFCVTLCKARGAFQYFQQISVFHFILLHVSLTLSRIMNDGDSQCLSFLCKNYFYECMHFLPSKALFIKPLSLLILALYSVSALLLCATVQ